MTIFEFETDDTTIEVFFVVEGSSGFNFFNKFFCHVEHIFGSIGGFHEAYFPEIYGSKSLESSYDNDREYDNSHKDFNERKGVCLVFLHYFFL